jgi:Ni/Co efflux regulator RcnB
MKKFILAALAASVAAAPVAAAPFDHSGRGQVVRVQKQQFRTNGRTVVTTRQVARTRQAQARSWRKGERFDSRQARNYRVISNPRAYRLYDAPRGYRWVQSNNDAVLVAITSGVIAAVLGGRL